MGRRLTSRMSSRNAESPATADFPWKKWPGGFDERGAGPPKTPLVAIDGELRLMGPNCMLRRCHPSCNQLDGQVDLVATRPESLFDQPINAGLVRPVAPEEQIHETLLSETTRWSQRRRSRSRPEPTGSATACDGGSRQPASEGCCQGPAGLSPILITNPAQRTASSVSKSS